jgi:predicted PhzF superfamily epimerase YddE/YHI9
MPTLHVLRVFTDADGNHGNPLGVFVDGAAIPRDQRQAIAARLGYSETVFIDDVAAGVVDIRTPRSELPFAGHPLVGTSWLLHSLGRPVAELRPAAGEVPTWSDPTDPTGSTVWIRARADWSPAMTLLEHPDAASIDALDADANDNPFIDHWAWIDHHSGVVRSRVFAPGVGIVEDEATGSAATRVVAALGQAVTIHQGKGSVLHARPGPEHTVDVGGRVVLQATSEDVGR